MYKYKNSLKSYDEAKYPYGMEFLKETLYDNFHGECVKEGFNIMSGGSKHLFCTPALSDFGIKMNVILSHYRAPYRNLVFSVLAGFDKKTCKGYDIEFKYEYDSKIFTISVVETTGLKKVTLAEKKYENVDLKYNVSTSLKITSDGKSVKGAFEKFAFDFDFAIPVGRLGIDVSYVSYGIIFSDVQITSDETFSKRKVFSKKYNLPPIRSEVRPYSIAVDLICIGESTYELKYKLTGGASSIPERDAHTHSWCLPYEDITNMYIKTINGKETKKYYLFNGLARFIEQNMRQMHLNFFKQVFDMKEVPVTGSFFVSDFPESALLGIGYEHLTSLPSIYVEGAGEHIYDNEDNLIYSGEPLEKEIITRLKSYDKKIVKKLPKTLWHYGDAVYHAENNHYFYTDEVPKFSLGIISNLNLENISVKVTLQDAYFTKIKEIKTEPIKAGEFSLLDYKDVDILFKLPKLEMGVYHISADIFYGGDLISNHTSSFEVMDENSDICPQDASGLPKMHLGDAGPALVYTGAPDFYAKTPECNFNHYVKTALYPPITAEEMRTWEIMKLYKREFSVWTTTRTVKNYDIANIPGVMANADYITPEVPGFEDFKSPFGHRYDCFRLSAYGNTMKTWLNEFLSIHPDYKKALKIEDAFEKFDHKNLVELLSLCGREWVDYILPKIREMIKAENVEMKKTNPKFQRCNYGPWSAYNCPYYGAYGAKWFGYDVAHQHEIYDGFMQLEDYPYSCAYRTTKSAWAVMTTKLLNHNLRVHPELYFDFPDACPDLAVACAYPPFGKSECPPHFTPTQICEYVYGTPYYDNGKFDYWRDYGFAPFQFIYNCDDRMKCILSLWKQVLENSPARPVKAPAFIYDINPEEDRYELHIKDGNLYNISETNLSYMYDLMKANGVPGGFGAMFKDIPYLSEKDVSAVVLPDMTNAPKDAIKKLRELHKKGVTLIAVSRVGELADIFGVKENLVKKDVNTLFASGKEEFIFPNTAEFFHENVSGEVLLSANDSMPVVIKNDNAILFNTVIGQVGIDSLITIDTNGRTNISRLIRSVLKDAVKTTVKSVAESSENSGITLNKTENGETLLVLTDYSVYDQNDANAPKRREICFNEEFKDIEYINVCNDNIHLGKNFENGILKSISVMIRPHETLMFKLK